MSDQWDVGPVGRRTNGRIPIATQKKKHTPLIETWFVEPNFRQHIGNHKKWLTGKCGTGGTERNRPQEFIHIYLVRDHHLETDPLRK